MKTPQTNQQPPDTLPSNPDAPYSLRSPDERQRRAALLAAPHIKPLTDYLGRIRQQKGDTFDMPAFDPLDGGIHARALLLLEAPGPKAVGSGFVSRNNPDPTARNLCELLAGAGIPRRDTLIWNIVPWYVGDADKKHIRPVTAADIRAALPHLGALIELLTDLRVIVLIGRKAEAAQGGIEHLTDVLIVATPHPSARVFNPWPAKRKEAVAGFAEVAWLLGQ